MTSNAPFHRETHPDQATDADAIKRLLERINATVAAEASLNATPVETPNADSLADLIECVRAQYQALAEIEIRRALATAADESASASTSGDGNDDPLRELEALVLSNAPMTDPVPVIPSPPSIAVAPEPVAPLYEGTIRLVVDSAGNMQRIIRLVDDIGQRPQFRILRMTGSPQREGADIHLGLREPVPFLELLRSMGHSAEAMDNQPGEGVPRIAVRLHAKAGD